ncbi:hypothetical protein E0K83_07055 [Gramella sp. BOM4]|nr:hypothetical protein [Christiangramia bathymodioli]
MTKSTRKLKLSFTELEFYESAVISTIKENLIFEHEHVHQLRQICLEHFGARDFVYITNRKYNYNVNPVIYLDLVKIGTLKGIAVLSDKIERLQTANFERNFSPVPYELFENREEALIWANGMVNEE